MSKVWSHILLAALAGFAFFAYGQELQKRELAEAAERSARAELDSLRAAGARVDTVWRLQRDTFRVLAVRLDTLTLTVDRWKTDTLRVVEYVARADSAIKACSALVLTCEQRGAIYEAQLDAWERRWDARPRPPGRLEETLEAVGWGLAGWLLRGLAR